MKELFHGTVYDITEIDITLGNGYKDFGKGFYATAIKSHAENIARRNKYIFEEREQKFRKGFQEIEGRCIGHIGIIWNSMILA